MAGYFDIMNGTPLYLMVIASLVIIGGLCVVVAVRAYRRAGELGMDKGTLMTIIRASAIYTIAPSLAIVVVFGPMQMVSGTVKMLTFLVSMVITLVQLLLIKKFRLNWLKNFTLANALLLGMVCSVLLEKLFG